MHLSHSRASLGLPSAPPACLPSVAQRCSLLFSWPWLSMPACRAPSCGSHSGISYPTGMAEAEAAAGVACAVVVVAEGALATAPPAIGIAVA
jgi:hypothetical protein